MMLCEKRGHQLGLEEGRGLGLEEGRGLGLEEGLEKGAQQTKRQIALNLIKEGVSPDLIFKATGLRAEDLQYIGSARPTSQETQ
jgi:predicted transposase YdaD